MASGGGGGGKKIPWKLIFWGALWLFLAYRVPIPQLQLGNVAHSLMTFLQGFGTQ